MFHPTTMPAAASLRRPLATSTLLLALSLVPAKSARAEGALSYKFQRYDETGGRIKVDAQYALIEQTLDPDTRLSLMGVVDTITGATPTGEPVDSSTAEVPLSQIDDKRRAWTFNASHQIQRVNLSVGASNSRESDYVSTGVSLNTLTDFNDKNTTLLVGIAGTHDDVKVFFQPEWLHKHTKDFIIGVTQLLSPTATATIDLSYGTAKGYLSDPYKIIEKDVELLPGLFLPLTYNENRPATREKWSLFASLNKSFAEGATSIESSYRFYHDTFGTNSHTLSLALFQQLGKHVVVSPSVRYYQQGAANFYMTSLNGTDIEPLSEPDPSGPFFSSDYRLSKLRSWTYGLKAVWNITDHVTVDVAYDRYDMTGRDSITPRSAYPEANIYTVGARVSW